MGPLYFNDSTKNHTVVVRGYINNPPSGLDISGECSIANDPAIDCNMVCTEIGMSGGVYNIECTISIPPIDYITTGHPYYNPGTRILSLSPNTYTITELYNNGNEKIERNYTRVMGDITITVTSHCGEGGCEKELGENQDNCCRDCGCSSFEDYFCYMGASPNGECVDKNDMRLEISGSEPDPWRCITGRIGGKCKYLRKHVLNLQIVNSPSDLDVLESRYSIDGGEVSPLDCIKTSAYGRWDCAIIPSDAQDGSMERTVSVYLTVGYTIEGENRVDNLSASAAFTTEGKKSDALISCENEIKRLREQRSRLENNQQGYGSWGWMYFVVGTIMVAIGYLLLRHCCWVAHPTCCAAGWSLIVSGGLQIVLGLLSRNTGTDLNAQLSQIDDLIEQKTRLCSSESFEKTAAATEGMGTVSPVIY